MRQKTRILIYILITIAVVIMGTIAILNNHHTDKPASAQEKIDLGRIYLTELSYEKAVLEFTEAIEIEPLNADAYLGLAEAYAGMGDTEKAAKTLEDGYAKTGDERLKDMREKLLLPDEIIGTTVSNDITSLDNEAISEYIAETDYEISEIIDENDYPQMDYDKNASFTIEIISDKEANIEIFSKLINDEYVIDEYNSLYDYHLIMGCNAKIDKLDFGIFVWGFNLQNRDKLTWNDVSEFTCIYVKNDDGSGTTSYDYAFTDSNDNWYIKATPNTDLHKLSLNIKLPADYDFNFNDYDNADVYVQNLIQQ